MLALLQKYVDISGYARAHKLHEESLKRMFTNDQSVFTPLMELLLDTEVWVDEEAPEIIRPYCEYIAKLEEEPADTKSQEIRKQVKHLQRCCTSILLMASQLSKTTVMASAYTGTRNKEGWGKGVHLGSPPATVLGPCEQAL